MTEMEHGRSGPRETPLTDPDVAAPSHAERARTLAAAGATGSLATIALEPAGFPHASFVTYAMDGPDPVFLISRLATHTQHLEADPRASLLVVERVADDPLANGRVTLIGPCVPASDVDHVRAVFLATHPGASYYAGFSDFRLYRLSVRSIRYIGGFGRMSWIDEAAWREAEPDPLAPHASAILDHMNEDHPDALRAYARAFTRAADAEEVVMTGVDRYGFELRVTTARGGRPARIAFETPVSDPGQVRVALVELAKRARAALGQS